MKSVIEMIDKYKVIAIVRGADRDSILQIAKALFDGGVRLMEITFDATGKVPAEVTAGMIEAVAKEYGDKMSIGAGTVLTEEQLLLAKNAGAKYIISPNTNCNIIRKTKEYGLVSIPGAMTPSECVDAHDAGADYIKLFPMNTLGIGYYKAISAPLSHIKFLAVGGVNAENLSDHLRAGVCGVGIGSDIVNPSLIKQGNFDEISRKAGAYMQAVRSFCSEDL